MKKNPCRFPYALRPPEVKSEMLCVMFDIYFMTTTVCFWWKLEFKKDLVSTSFLFIFSVCDFFSKVTVCHICAGVHHVSLFCQEMVPQSFKATYGVLS